MKQCALYYTYMWARKHEPNLKYRRRNVAYNLQIMYDNYGSKCCYWSCYVIFEINVVMGLTHYTIFVHSIPAITLQPSHSNGNIVFNTVTLVVCKWCDPIQISQARLACQNSTLGYFWKWFDSGSGRENTPIRPIVNSVLSQTMSKYWISSRQRKNKHTDRFVYDLDMSDYANDFIFNMHSMHLISFCQPKLTQFWKVGIGKRGKSGKARHSRQQRWYMNETLRSDG